MPVRIWPSHEQADRLSDITAPAIAVGAHPFSIASSAHALSDIRDENPPEASQTFIVRVRTGFTKRLAEYAKGERDAVGPHRVNGPRSDDIELGDGDLKSGFPSRRLRILSEGPYGPTAREGEEYQTVLMVTGGAVDAMLSRGR